MSFLSSTISDWKQQFAELLTLPELAIENRLITKIKYKNKNNELHRNTDIGPAFIWYYDNGQIKYKG